MKNILSDQPFFAAIFDFFFENLKIREYSASILHIVART